MTSTLDVATEPLLSASSDAVIRATAGVVAEHADLITARFYPAMLAAHPD